MIKSDRWIRRMAQEHDMINPYSEKQVSAGVISYGVSSYGYDLRVADEFKIFTNVVRYRERRRSHCAAKFVCPGALGRVLQDSA
jgi:deoxycytidine triphosphate deaminase